MTKDEILQIFEDSGALLSGHFKLTSGRHSDIYYEKFTLLKNPAICTRICEEMAGRFKNAEVSTVIGPTLGGVIIAYDVARYLGTESIYAEAAETGRQFKRGFTLEPGERVVIVDDVLTTGRSLKEVIALVKSYEATIVGITVLLDRSGGNVDLGQTYTALAVVSAESWEEAECPLCAKGESLTQRGSRAMQK